MVRPALFALGLGGILLCTYPGAAAKDGSQLAPLALPASKAQAVQAFVDAHPANGFHLDVGGRIETVYGKAFSFGATPQTSAEQFRLNHAGMWGIAPEDLAPIGPFQDGAHTVPIMYEKDKGTYKFTGVYYMQTRDGVEVYRSRVMMLARNEANYPVVLASADLRDIGNFRVAGGAAQAMNSAAALKNAAALMPADTVFTEPRLVIWAGLDEWVVDPVLAMEFIGMGGTPEGGDLKHELFIANAATGVLIHSESLIHHVDIVGTVQGVATEGNGADTCAGVSPRGIPYAEITAGVTTVYADADGNYVLPNAGTAAVNVTSAISSLYFAIDNDAGGGVPSTLMQSVTPPGPGDFLHNAANTDEFIRAQVNAVIHANVVRDYILQFNPSYPTIATQTNMETNVNINQNCNAFYSIANQTINFYRSGGGCSNTANSTVVYHEFGHHVVQMGGSGQGAYGEGMSDCIAVLISDDPCLGQGFGANFSSPPCSASGASCTGCLRTADNNSQYQTTGCSSCGSGAHNCGMLISGCVWSTRNALAFTNPSTYRDIISNLTINSVLLHTGTSITPAITTHFLTLDDDDSDIGNGTPHYNEIATGFGAHNMPAPPLNLLAITYPNGQPAFVAPNGTTTMEVAVAAVAGTPQPDTGKLWVSAGGGPFVEHPMTETSPNQYLATFPTSTCGVQVRYYLSAMTTTNQVVNSPSGAPASTFSATSGTGPGVFVFEDDFEANLGWTVTDSIGLTTGTWERGVPIPSSAAPSVDADGSGQCYVTDNASGNFDIDGGSTTLTSPLMNADVDAAAVSYWRWYNNNTGAAPQADVMVVEISDDGGATWINLETVGPTVNSPNPEVNGGWFNKTYSLGGISGFELNNQFRIRFTASDLGTGSYVEAGVDGVEVQSIDCGVQVPGDVTGDGIVDVADLLAVIGAWGPCPGCAADLDGDGDVDVNDLLLVINNWS